jgi:hypothetical protein
MMAHSLRRFPQLLANVQEHDELAPNLQRYWSDPAYRAEIAAERDEHYRRANALIDEGIRKARADREQREKENERV